MRKILVIFGILILIAWAWLKWMRFETGAYYMDVYIHDQISRLWMSGQPLFFDYRYGNHGALHNFFLSPLLAPFTMLLGVPGLFVVQLLCSLWALYNLSKFMSTKAAGILSFAVLLGPFAFWIFDNNPYGYHAELLYFPLCIAWAAALVSGKKVQSILLGILIFLVREDGIILIWTGMTLWAFPIAMGIGAPKWSFEKIAILSLACSTVFLLSMLQIQSSEGTQNRLAMALSKIGTQPELLMKHTWLNIRGYIYLLMPTLLLLFIAVADGKRWLKSVGLLMLVSLPVFAASCVSALYYFPDMYHSLLWQPRLSALWSVGNMMLVMLFYRHAENLEHLRLPVGVVLVIMLWVFQFGLLASVKDQNLIQMMGTIQSEKKVYAEDASFPIVKSWAQNIDRKKVVGPTQKYFHLFHRHRAMWPQFMDSPVAPDYIIYLESDSGWHRNWTEGYDSMWYDSGIGIKKKNDLPWPASTE